jgi:hypothetical protein
MRLEFGEWLPDLPVHGNPGCLEAKNVIPLINSFGPLKNLTTFSGALTEACLGAFYAPNNTGAAINVAGDASKLYVYNGTSAAWADKSRKQATGGNTASYGIATAWEFEKFGDYIIATDFANAPQRYNLSASASETFVDLAGSPPQARYVAVVRDFLVIAHLSTSRFRVQWSGFNNSETWSSSLVTQSDFQDLPGSGGVIQGIVSGEYGVVITEGSIWRFDYVGPPIVFQFDEVEPNRGTPSPRSIVRAGNLIFYYEHSGFEVFDGARSQSIGENKVDAWFKRECGDLSSIQGAVDRTNQLVMWGFKTASSLTYNDRIIIFNWASNRWSWGAINTQYIYERVTEQLTLDQLDTPLPGGIDADSIPMDALYFGNDLTLSAFDANKKAGAFDGSALGATIISSEISIPDSGFYTTGVRPLIDAGDVTVQVGGRNKLTETAAYSNAVSLNRIGEAPIRTNKRYQRFRLNVTNEFDFLQGLEINGTSSGRRG